MTYTEIDLAVLRTRSELDAAKELTGLARVDLALICQALAIRTGPKMSSIDLVTMILARTHPRQAQAAPVAPAAEQARMF
jgi:hypothetical protein